MRYVRLSIWISRVYFLISDEECLGSSLERIFLSLIIHLIDPGTLYLKETEIRLGGAVR